MFKYKAIIFDFDDTLTESWRLKWDHHKATAKKFYNLTLTDEEIKVHYGKPLNELLVSLYKTSDPIEKIHKNLISIRDEFLKKVADGAVDTVNVLLNRGFIVGVISATNKQYLVEDLTRMEFSTEKFFHIQGADETEVHKPHPGVFLKVLEKLSKAGIAKHEIVCIGDSIYDLQAAHGAEIDFIGITTGLYSEDELKANGAKIVIKKISELLNKI